MKDEKGLGGYGIKGLRKNLLAPRVPRTRRMFRNWPTKTYPRPSRDAAPQWLVYSLTRRLYAECRNVEVVWMGPVMAVVMAVVLMLGLEVTVWADEDDDEKAEMRDFVAAVYRGQGQYNMAGSIATGEGGVIMKRGSVWLTPRGQYQKVGSVYLTPDGGVVTRAGSTFIDEDEVITKAGSTYTGGCQTTTTAGSVVLKPRWATR
jgi:hypothetical protein